MVYHYILFLCRSLLIYFYSDSNQVSVTVLGLDNGNLFHTSQSLVSVWYCMHWGSLCQGNFVSMTLFIYAWQIEHNAILKHRFYLMSLAQMIWTIDSYGGKAM